MGYDLHSRVSIVTGALGGIGRAIYEKLAMYGSNIILFDIIPEESKVAKEAMDYLVSKYGIKAGYYMVDVSKYDNVVSGVNRALADFGRIDILINNAGILGPIAPVVDYPIEDWNKVLAVNLSGAFYMLKAVLPIMIRQNYGRIVNISSIAGKEGNPNMAAYVASKHGILGLTKTVAKEVIQYNIRINAVCPALVDTPMLKQFPQSQLELLRNRIPLGRFAKPEEVAELVLFLVASPAVDFITGQCFNITGGRGEY
jgi:3-oxoacyl-[acyl-carrier protein] reductase